VELVAYLAAPFLGLLVSHRGRLPGWLSWFETADNTTLGDLGHQERWVDRSLCVRSVAWLWRNKAYTFRNEVIGADTSGPVTASGNPETGDRPLIEGWCLRRTPEGYWHLYVVRRWGLGFFLRVNLGWKLWGGPGRPNFGQYVFAIHPFRRVQHPNPSRRLGLGVTRFSSPWRQEAVRAAEVAPEGEARSMGAT
jgi:hypothetical protein